MDLFYHPTVGFFLTPSQATAEDGLASSGAPSSGHFLYVATPGIRDYLGYGGHGLLVFAIDDQHRFVRRIPTQGFHKDGRPANVKGIAVSAQLNGIFISTLYSLQRIDLATDQLLWERAYEGGRDRMSISPDGKTMYLLSLEKEFWNVVACEDGEIIIIQVHSRVQHHLRPLGQAGLHGRYRFAMAACGRYFPACSGPQGGAFQRRHSPLHHQQSRDLVFATVNDLLGFEVGDLVSGEKLTSIQVVGWDKGPRAAPWLSRSWDRPDPERRRGLGMRWAYTRLHVFEAHPPFSAVDHYCFG